MSGPWINEPALLAAIELVERAGATEYEVGYLNDTERSVDADWWATARWNGTRVMVEHHPGPVEATVALARKVMHRSRCNHCGKPIRLVASRIKGKARKQLCGWRYQDGRWRRGCER